jgi:NADPH-dependent 2,4-dienoyl-CoA reductase/sulfur reductase-like enzyme/rhodanese-related sulfurtransferase
MKIVIVGGVAAGMSTAARLRRLDEHAEIVVLDRDRYVSYANCGLPYHIGGEIVEREKLLVVTPDHLRATLHIDVRTEHEVTAIDRAGRQIDVLDLSSGERYRERYDRLVLAQGGEPLRLPIPGVEHPKVYVLRNIPDMDAIKAEVDGGAQRAVVIGGSYIGVEIAEALRHRGLDVQLVELQEQVMPPLDLEMATDLRYHMESHRVTLHLGTSAKAFRDHNGQVLVDLASGETLPADLVVMAVGVRPAAGIAVAAGLELGPRGGIKVDAHMRTSDPLIYAAGDMVEVFDTVTGEPTIIPLAGPANRQGRIVADHIAGKNSAYSSSQGTAIVKVFEMTAGATGASEKMLTRLNRPFHKIYIHPAGHASYYPGTAPMHIKLIFEPENGKILGAQIVGYDGVDKRLDVFATAIRAGLTVFDLEHLELAYAPPYGSAKDPVNMAGFVGANMLRGDVDFWYAEDYPDNMPGGAIIDVRGPAEYDEWHLPEAINVPLPELRERVAEVAAAANGGPVWVYCRVGFRSYLAYRLLRQSGLKRVATLAGGSRTFTCYHRTPLATGRPGAVFVSHAEEEIMSMSPWALKHA